MLVPGNSCAQGVLPGWNPISWFDWSDFRVDVNGRVMVPTMTLGKFEGATLNPTTQRISANGGTIDFKSDLGMDEDRSAFSSVQFTAYIDRLGFRICYDAGQVFTGRQDIQWGTPIPTDPPTPQGALVPKRVAVSELDADSGRIGLDLDIIRYPFLRVGINFDVNTSKVTFTRRYWNRFDVSQTYPPKFIEFAHCLQPITIGAHATAIPVRVRDVPVILQARARVPVPFLSQIPALLREYEARIFDIEVSGGLRPAVWETSLFGYSTFSIGVMAGYRWQYLEGQMVGHHHEYADVGGGLISYDKFDITLKAAWHGAFVQLKAGF
jgi:hypothetical protein